MISTIDDAGRLVIPREIRRAAGLVAGGPIDVSFDDGAVIIKPAPTQVSLERKGRFVVARPARPLPALAGRAVEETRERLGAARGASRGRNKKR